MFSVISFLFSVISGIQTDPPKKKKSGVKINTTYDKLIGVEGKEEGR